LKSYELKFDQENGQISRSSKPINIGCVLSGGQAAGGHNVIMGLFDMAKKLHPDSKVYGFIAGLSGLFTEKYIEITEEYIDLYRNMGGFDIVRAGRCKSQTEKEFNKSLKMVEKLDLDGLAIIGGDGSNAGACVLAEYFAKHNSKCAVIGCPKTIDGDLLNENIEMSFGFDTASKVYSEMIGNLCIDAVSSKNRYHFVKIMGRSASHLALECAL
jgi:diphosphate--fructose-6-phosphate 1-phosphotransferase